jgi:hypothetical protein
MTRQEEQVMIRLYNRLCRMEKMTCLLKKTQKDLARERQVIALHFPFVVTRQMEVK